MSDLGPHNVVAPAFATRSYASGWRPVTLATAQVSWSLRNSAEFTTLRSMFASVVVTRVCVVVAQSHVSLPEDESTTLPTHTLDFGLSERDRANVDFGAEPDFESLTVGGASPRTARVVWGQGGQPFPNGLQLDLRLCEQRFKWPSFYIGHDFQEAGNQHELVRFKVVVTVRCEALAASV